MNLHKRSADIRNRKVHEKQEDFASVIACKLIIAEV